MEVKINSEIPIPSSMGKLNNRAQKKSDQQLMEKCREFEAVIFQKMIEVMQGNTEIFGKGVQGEYLRGVFAEEMAKELAKDPGLGLAKSLYQVLLSNNNDENN